MAVCFEVAERSVPSPPVGSKTSPPEREGGSENLSRYSGASRIVLTYDPLLSACIAELWPKFGRTRKHPARKSSTNLFTPRASFVIRSSHTGQRMEKFVCPYPDSFSLTQASQAEEKVSAYAGVRLGKLEEEGMRTSCKCRFTLWA